MQSLSVFTELFALGMHPIPVIWDVQTKQVIKHPEHIIDTKDGIPKLEDIQRWLNNGFSNFNGIALKMLPPFGMFDFDLKNTENKGCYQEWLKIISNTIPDVLSKICIETTRSGGYHVYIKYSKLSHKIPVARNPAGGEVIAVYTGGLLSYCYPSPHYSIVHNEFQDIAELTDFEYETMVKTAALFNECDEILSGETKVAVINYPTEYENICLQFDSKCTDEVFEQLLNMIGLFRVKDKFNRKKWIPFLREGSAAIYSAKAYFKSKRLLIFSGSFNKFPTWHDSAKTGDDTWSLSPSKIVFYHCNKNWIETIDTIKIISDSACIDLVEHTPVTQQPIIPFDRLKFPYDIFPERIRNFIAAQTIQNEYLAGALLGSLSTAIGNTVLLHAKEFMNLKPIVYLAIIAHPGAAKTPALKVAFSAMEEYDSGMYEQYQHAMQTYNKEMALYEKDKKSYDKPEKPTFPQTLIKDSTIEMVIKILSQNKQGCTILADELSGFIKRMNQYKSGDEVQKWLELWSGSPVLLQRISREENKVTDPFCSVVGGIQPGVLESLSKEENEHNGFFHRFLFIYPKQQDKASWKTPNPPEIITMEFYRAFSEILHHRQNTDKITYFLSPAADELYGQWHDYKNLKYNKTDSPHVKGIIAKYQEYCLRLALLIQVIEDGLYRRKEITEITIEKAIRLTEYFLGNMHKAIKLLVPETPVDKLSELHKKLYDSLSESFSTKTAVKTGEQIGMTEGAVKMFLKRGINKIFNQLGTGEYSKIY